MCQVKIVAGFEGDCPAGLRPPTEIRHALGPRYRRIQTERSPMPPVESESVCMWPTVWPSHSEEWSVRTGSCYQILRENLVTHALGTKVQTAFVVICFFSQRPSVLGPSRCQRIGQERVVLFLIKFGDFPLEDRQRPNKGQTWQGGMCGAV